MSNPSTPPSLAERLAARTASDLAARTASDLAEVAAQTQSALQQLASSLQQQHADALRTMSSDTTGQLEALQQQLMQDLEQVRRMSRLSAQAWLRRLLISLALVPAIGLGCWGLIESLSWKVRDQVSRLTELNQQIATQQQTLAQIEAKTWGVVFRNDSSGRFLVLPDGVEGNISTFGSKRAVQLFKK
jgi:exonuclease VII large subunit